LTDSSPSSPGGSIRGVPPAAWLFIGLAAGVLVLRLPQAVYGPSSTPLSLFYLAAVVVNPAGPVLVPAALLIRYPDAARRAPVLTLGAVLYALGAALSVVGPQVTPFVVSLVSGVGTSSALADTTVLAALIASLTAAGGVTAIAVGAMRARRRSDGGGAGWTILVLLFAALLVASRVAETANILMLVPAQPGALLYTGSGFVSGIVSILACSFLTVSALRGVRAGEAPVTGWWLATLAGAATLVASEFYPLVLTVLAPDTTVLDLISLAAVTFAVGPLLVFLAFAAAWPGLDRATSRPD
jgi:hypothetical protein